MQAAFALLSGRFVFAVCRGSWTKHLSLGSCGLNRLKLYGSGDTNDLTETEHREGGLFMYFFSDSICFTWEGFSVCFLLGNDDLVSSREKRSANSKGKRADFKTTVSSSLHVPIRSIRSSGWLSCHALTSTVTSSRL